MKYSFVVVARINVTKHEVTFVTKRGSNPEKPLRGYATGLNNSYTQPISKRHTGGR